MKIVVTGTRGFPNVQGGVENHCEHLYPILADLGCDITVFTRKPYIKEIPSEYNGVRLIPVSCPRNKFFEAIIHTFKSVLKARRLRPDILHIHAIGPSLFAPIARAFGMKVVVTHHGPDYMRKKWSMPAKLFLKLCESAGMIFSNEIIAISDNIAADIKNKFNREATVLPNGIEAPIITKKEENLKKYCLKKKKFILAVGRFVPEKGFHDLIDAFNRGDFRDIKLVIAGDSDHEDTYSHDLKIKASKCDNIVLTGFITEKPLHELYSHAGLFVLPSYYEGLPIALLEAMSYGLPCIASDIPANRNVQIGEGRFFKAGDIGSILDKINEYMNRRWDEDDRRNQRNMIYKIYNWRRIAEDTLLLYNKIVP